MLPSPHSYLPNDYEHLHFAIQAAGIGSWSLDLINQTVWWDARCKELYGFNQGDVVPYEQVLAYMHEADRQAVDQAVRWALDPQSGGAYNIQFRTIGAADGQLRWLHCQGKAYINDEGIPYRFAGIAQDITQQVLASQRAETSEQRFRDLVLSSPTGTVLFIGREMRVDLVNSVMLRIWGKADDILGQTLHEAMPELVGQPFLELLQRVFDTGQPYHNEEGKANIVVDGQLQEYWFNFSYKPLYDAQGTIYGVVNTATDVTRQVVSRRQLQASESRFRMLSQELDSRVQERTQALQQVNQDLKRSNENLQQFAYIASHDLQEPLRKIQSFGSLLLNQPNNTLDELTQNYLRRMVLAGERMSTLVKDLLTFSRISTRQQSFGLVSLQTIINDTLATLDLVIEQRQVQLTVDALPTIKGDELQLGQLFQNLVSNAIKFTPADQAPCIHIGVGECNRSELPLSIRPNNPAQRFHHITISDRGIGFEPKYLDRIFQVFQRLHSRDKYPGTGIGLAICEKVATNHGGAITASSQPGEGATFSVYLPI